jgi:hypothetical protein
MSQENQKPLSTHEFAKLLLSMEDRPLVSKDSYECQSEYDYGYSNVTGIDFNSTEKHAVLVVDYLSAEVNDKFIRKGDVYVKFEDSDGTFLIQREEAISMSIGKSTHYFNYHFDKIGFKDIEYNEEMLEMLGDIHTYIETNVKVAMEDGFHPKLKEMSVAEMMDWFEENLPEHVAYEKEEMQEE